MSDKLILTRQQIAKMAQNDPMIIKALEKLFHFTTQSAPSNLQEVQIDAGTSQNEANQALSEIEEVKKGLQSILLAPPQEKHGFETLDYIQFRNTYQRVKLPGQLHWSYTYGDLQFTHIGGLVQSIGIDQIVHVYNNSGATITKGSVVRFSGGATGQNINIGKYIADGTMPSLVVVGIVAEDILNGAEGHTYESGYIRNINASGSLYTETWAIGDILYASPTVSGGLTKTKPTAPNECVPIATVIDNSSTTGVLYVRATIEQQFYYGTFVDTTNHAPAVINTAYPITLNATSISNGLSRGATTSQIIASVSGLYRFGVSIQITSTNSSSKNLWFWFRKNGVDIANSARQVSVDSATAVRSPSMSFSISMSANDYVEIYYASDNTGVQLTAVPASAFAPACPSIIVVVDQTAQ